MAAPWMAVLLMLLVTISTTQADKKRPDALVEMVPGVDDKVFGKLALYKQEHGVYIEGIIHNIKPGLHGFHVHDKGLLGNKCMDAGPHFNPFEKTHAGPKDHHRHSGDLGNVFVDKSGVAKISIFDSHISLHPKDKTYIGKRSFVIHAKPDDLGRGGDDESLRTGNAGGRLSCGIVIVLGHALKEPPPVYRRKSKKHGKHSGYKIYGGFGGYGDNDDEYSGGRKHSHGGGFGKSNSIKGHGYDNDDEFFKDFHGDDFGFGRIKEDDNPYGFGQSSRSRNKFRHKPKFSNHNRGFPDEFGRGRDDYGFKGSGSQHHPQRQHKYRRNQGDRRNPFHYFGRKLHGYGSSQSIHRLPPPLHQKKQRFSQPILEFW